jgi:hypothetical protein
VECGAIVVVEVVPLVVDNQVENRAFGQSGRFVED